MAAPQARLPEDYIDAVVNRIADLRRDHSLAGRDIMPTRAPLRRASHGRYVLTS